MSTLSFGSTYSNAVSSRAHQQGSCRLVSGQLWLEGLIYLSIYLSTIPAVDEVRDGVVDAEGRCVQVSADLHVVSGHEAHCCLVLVVEDLPLEGGAQQQHEVIWKRRETNKPKKKESQQLHILQLDNSRLLLLWSCRDDTYR